MFNETSSLSSESNFFLKGSRKGDPSPKPTKEVKIKEKTLNINSHSRRPKSELTGLLVPTYTLFQNRIFKYKLITESKEYLLSMESDLAHAANSAVWEKVTVRGYLDYDTDIFNVEKLTVKAPKNINPIPSNLKGLMEIDFYKKIINQYGKLEPSIDYLAS